MENTQTEIKKVRWHQSPEAGGILSIFSAVLSLITHNPESSAGWSILGFIVGIFGIIKGNRLGKILSIIGIIISVVSFLVFNPFQSHIQTADGSVYSNTEYGFQITPPTGWTISKTPTSGAIVAFVDSVAPQSDYPVITINLLSADNVNLDDYVNNGTTNVPYFSLINKKKFGSGGDSYYIIESKMDINKISDGKIGNIGSSAHALMLTKQAKDGRFFIVTGESDYAAWSKYATIIKNSLLSFGSQ